MATSQVSDNFTVTSKQARKAILAAFNAKRPVFLWGAPGIGKSEVISEITEELGGAMIDLRMAQMEPTDIRGIPFFNKDNGKMDWAPPVDLPDAEFASKYPVVVLFLDEMNSAPPSVQAAGYQLILNRRVGKYILPDNVVIVAAGNRDSDKGVTYRMPMPLANRFIHIEMRPDFNSWQDWALTNGIHRDVVGYLTYSKQDLYDFDSKSSSKAFATPRTWTFVSQLLSNKEIDDDTLYTLLTGAIGEGLAYKFKAYRKFVKVLPNPRDILDGKVTDLAVKEISAMYSLATGLAYEFRDLKNDTSVNSDQFHEKMDNFFTYIMKNFETELVVMCSNTIFKKYGIDFDMTKLKTLDEFYNRYNKFVNCEFE